VPPQKKGDLMNSTIPTLFDPPTLSSTSTPNLVSATVPPDFHPQRLPQLPKTYRLHSSKESNDFDASSNPVHTRQKSAIGSEFNDDFNRSEADITALDALLASQNRQKLRRRKYRQCRILSARYEQKELGAADPVFAGDFDDEFGEL
jgi:hypothetical protein